MAQKENQKLIIHSYQKLWKWNMRIYALSKDLPLPAAIQVRFALYLIIGGILAILVFRIPFLSKVPFAIKTAFAIGVAKFLDTVKLDGKNPILFFIGCLRFWIFEQGTSIENFQRYDNKIKDVKFCWYAGNKTEKEPCYHARPIKLQWSGGIRKSAA